MISKKITSDLRSLTNNTWNSFEITWDHPMFSEITGDQLWSPEDHVTSPSVQLRSPHSIWYLTILPEMTWHRLRSPEIFWNHRKYTQIFAVQFKILGRAWDQPGSPDIFPYHFRSAEISWDHLRSPQFNWGNHLIIWYLMIPLDMTSDHSEVTSDLLKSSKISTDFCSAVQNTWESVRSAGITRHFPRSLEIIWDHLRSPKITSIQLGSSEIIWYLLSIAWRDLRSPQLTWDHLRSYDIKENNLRSS